MKRLLVLGEGDTEEAVFNRILRPHFWNHGIDASCTMICTSRENRVVRRHRGGHAHKYSYIRRDIVRLLGSNPDAVTTMIDVYAFPRDMPGYPDPWPMHAQTRHAALARAFAANVSDLRFIPGLLLHEFEGLLFANPEIIAEIVLPQGTARAEAASRLRSIAASHPSPEDIDDSPISAPSKRLEDVIPEYDKLLHGPTIIERIGLQAVRNRCASFHGWLAALENLGVAVNQPVRPGL